MLDRLERLPGPQRDALGAAFGLSAGHAPDRFLVGLAVLSLLAEVAEEGPVVCLIDDGQWLDRASAQALAFVARRLLAESVGVIFGVRTGSEEREAAAPASEAGLLEVGARVRFRHPLVRSAVYRAASVPDRQRAHRVLAEATDPDVDPDRRAWHRANATAGLDEDVAHELERSADRAQARGGLAAAAAFLERAAA